MNGTLPLLRLNTRPESAIAHSPSYFYPGGNSSNNNNNAHSGPTPEEFKKQMDELNKAAEERADRQNNELGRLFKALESRIDDATNYLEGESEERQYVQLTEIKKATNLKTLKTELLQMLNANQQKRSSSDTLRLNKMTETLVEKIDTLKTSIDDSQPANMENLQKQMDTLLQTIDNVYTAKMTENLKEQMDTLKTMVDGMSKSQIEQMNALLQTINKVYTENMETLLKKLKTQKEQEDQMRNDTLDNNAIELFKEMQDSAKADEEAAAKEKAAAEAAAEASQENEINNGNDKVDDQPPYTPMDEGSGQYQNTELF